MCTDICTSRLHKCSYEAIKTDILDLNISLRGRGDIDLLQVVRNKQIYMTFVVHSGKNYFEQQMGYSCHYNTVNLYYVILNKVWNNLMEGVNK